MSSKILFFGYKDKDKNKEKEFLSKKYLDNFEIKFFENNLTNETLKIISPADLENTEALSVNENSILDNKVIGRFKNLRIIYTRSKSYNHINLQCCIDKNIALLNFESGIENLNTALKKITGVMCGEKKDRII